MGIKVSVEQGETKIDDEALSQLKLTIAKAFADAIKNRVLSDAIPSMGPKNFEGEAIMYLRETKQPMNPKAVAAQSAILFQSFIKDADSMVSFDEESGQVCISPFINALEYGDYFRPILKTLTRAMNDVCAKSGLK